jgi:environmental stress-induced protein Ves
MKNKNDFVIRNFIGETRVKSRLAAKQIYRDFGVAVRQAVNKISEERRQGSLWSKPHLPDRSD